MSHLQSIVFGENQSFNYIYLESTFGITIIFSRKQKPNCSTMLRLSAASGPPRFQNRSVVSSGWLKLGSTAFGRPRAMIVNNVMVTSYHIGSLKRYYVSQNKMILCLHSQLSLMRKPEHNFDNRRDQSPNGIGYPEWDWRAKTTIKLEDKR